VRTATTENTNTRGPPHQCGDICETENKQIDQSDYVSDGVCMLRAYSKGFLMDHKGGAAYRGRPHCLLSQRIIWGTTQTHSQNAIKSPQLLLLAK